MELSLASQKPGKVLSLTVYYVILCGFLAGHYFPDLRIWGVNAWAYFPMSVIVLLFAIGAVAPLVPALFSAGRRRSADRPIRFPLHMYVIATILIVVSFGLLFYWLRARTHFLGDGYLLLGKLSDQGALIKSWDIVTNAAYRLLFNLLDGYSGDPALVTYQTVSILCGVAFLTIVAIAARTLFEQAMDRILFLLGMASCGFCLLFYGYVENYPLFVLSVTGFCLIGLLVARGRMNRWWTLLPLASAAATHIFGITLIPAALYLWLEDSRLAERLSGKSRLSRWLIAGLGFAALASCFLYLYSTNLPFRLAVVPLVDDQFTIERYTLLSLKHIIDYFNLLILLLPALPLFVLLTFSLPLRKLICRKEYRFPLILSASVLAAVFIFNPRLGMPRDWDLFSYAGVPLALLFYFLVIDQRERIRSYRVILSLSILLGFLSLIPRAASFASPEIGLSYFRNYAMLDKLKNRTAHANLIQYFVDEGDMDAAHLETVRRDKEYPQNDIATEAESLFIAGQVGQAVDLLKKLIEFDPSYEYAYFSLGTMYLQTHRIDSGFVVLQIAAGLNPYSALIQHNLGVAHLHTRQFEKAEAAFLKALNLNDTLWDSHMFLLNLYKLQNKSQEYRDHLARLDSSTFRNLTDRYPQLLSEPR